MWAFVIQETQQLHIHPRETSGGVMQLEVEEHFPNISVFHGQRFVDDAQQGVHGGEPKRRDSHAVVESVGASVVYDPPILQSFWD